LPIIVQPLLDLERPVTDSRFAILVIEDDSAHRTMVRRLVAPDGSALDELRLVRAERPDLPDVMHTGDRSPEHEVEALAGGVEEVRTGLRRAGL
jgi:hypothetical protein